MIRIGLLATVLAAGCSPKLEIRLGSPTTVATSSRGISFGTCKPTQRVTVTDSWGTPMVDAAVVVRQIEYTQCPSAGPAAVLYTTEAVRTDKHGVAVTCAPQTAIADSPSSICPHHRDAAVIVVVADGKAAELTQPFETDLHAVVTRCEDSQSPLVPCSSVLSAR